MILHARSLLTYLSFSWQKIILQLNLYHALLIVILKIASLCDAFIIHILIIILLYQCMQHNIQSNWYLEWHFDLLILWALAYTNEISKAEALLGGLKFRLEGSSYFHLHLLMQFIII